MRGRISQIAEWIDDRTHLPSETRRFLFEEIPASAGWPQVFGSVALFLFLLQSLTGILLALNYAPTAGDAYTSLTYIIRQVAAGRLIRGLHHWGASLMIVVVVVHMAQVFIFGAFKRPREVTWLAGVVLLLLTFGFGLTGYLLPWDNRAYWGTVVTTKILAGLPIFGPFLARLSGASEGVGSITFSRFYALHTLVLPATASALIAIHVYLVRRHGITPSRLSEGHQMFYPQQLFRDFCAIFVAFLCLFAAACFLEVPLERMADATDTTYVPRPEWYFLFLFQLLKLFPGQLELFATLILPGAAIVMLMLLPFLRKTQATILKTRLRSASVVVLLFSVWLALTSAAAWSGPSVKQRPAISSQTADWARISPEAIAGYGYFQSLQCASCHNLIVGTPKPGPTLGLTGIQHPRDWILQHFSEAAKPGANGIAAAPLSLPERNALLIFVAGVKPDLLPVLPAISPEFIDGAQTFVANACASCHRVNGVGGDLGPSLNGLPDRRSKSWVHAHFLSPRKLTPGSVMPPYHFDQKKEDNLIQYLYSLPE